MEALKFIFDFLCYHGFKNISFSTNDFKNTDLHKSSTSSASSQIGDDTDNLLDICDNKTFAYVFSELIEKLLMEGPDLEGREELQRSAEDHVKLLLFDVAAKGTCKIMNLGKPCCQFDSLFFTNGFLPTLFSKAVSIPTNCWLASLSFTSPLPISSPR